MDKKELKKNPTNYEKKTENAMVRESRSQALQVPFGRLGTSGASLGRRGKLESS